MYLRTCGGLSPQKGLGPQIANRPKIAKPRSETSVASPGCLSRITNPNFFDPGTRIRIKEFEFLTQKIISKL